MKGVAVLAFAAWIVAPSVPLAAAGATPPMSTPAARTLLDRYCVNCHNTRAKVAGLALDTLDVGQIASSAEMWEKVARKLRSRAMPPAGNKRPDKAAYEELTRFLEGALDRAAVATPDPGRTTIHRLNRVEYTNAVRDVLGLEIDSQEMLPGDSASFGFDNIADVLSISPGLMERYLFAARKVSQLALGDDEVRAGLQTYKASPLALQNTRMSEDLPFGSRGGISAQHRFPVNGTYTLTVRLLATLHEADRVDVRIDGVRVALLNPSDVSEGGAYQRVNTVAKVGRELPPVRVPVRAGTHTVGVTVQYATPTGPREDIRLNLADLPVISRGFTQPGIHSLDVGGPYDQAGEGDTPSRRRILSCRPSSHRDEHACATRVLSAVARRAYRRPVTPLDVRSLLAFYDAGRKDGDFEAGLRRALERILVAPEFLYRIEREPAGVKPGAAYRLGDIELASRLSFFLWSSVPDDRLLELAERRRLSEPRTLEAEVRRMLADPRARTLVSNFGSQWLITRNLRAVAPDAQAFPDFSDSLRDAFARETELFLESQIREDRPVPELLTADYTFVNETLARFYGIPGVYGSHFRRVKLTDPVRAGLLGQGSILVVTSYPTRTSPTLRGKWVLENLLGAPPPPPPPNVEGLKDGKGDNGERLSMRARMERHRRNPVCASCHGQMDPLGFALENYDAIGRWRATDESERPIDASGVLPDGRKFEGPAQLRGILFERRAEFVSTLVEKLLTYALGRGLTYRDTPAVRAISRDAEACGYRWSCVVQGVVRSVPFQMRRADS